MTHELSYTEKLKIVLEKAQISEIIIVDDDCEADYDLKECSSVLGQIKRLYGDKEYDKLAFLEECLLRNNLHAYDDFDEIREEISEKWETWSADDRRAVAVHLDLDRENEPVGQIVSLLQSELLATKITIYGVQDWIHRFKSLETESPDNRPKILVFFDEDLKKIGTSIPRGRDLICEIMKSDAASFIIPGLLTQKATNETEEISLANELSDDGIFVGVLGKYRKSDPDDFCKGIISYFLINCLQTVKDIVFDKYLNDAAFKAKLNKSIRQNILLDILHTASLEGMPVYKEFLYYAIDYHSLTIENEIRSACIENTKATLLEELESHEIKGINVIDNSYEEAREEVDETLAYISGDKLSETHHPLEIGDIFCIRNSGEPRYYGLLNQPCSVALRRDGTRKQDKITLVKLIYGAPPSRSVRAGSVSTGLPRFSEFDSSFYCSESKKPYIYFDFTNTLLIPSNVLDLCAFDDAGNAQTVALHIEKTGLLEFSMRRKQRELDQWRQSILKNYHAYENYLDDLEHGDVFLNLVLKNECHINSDEIQISINNADLNFNIKRIGRLKEKYSHGILIEYARYLSRPAYPITLIEE